MKLYKSVNGLLLGADKGSVRELSNIPCGRIIEFPSHKTKKPQRSTVQNAYYWAVVIETLYNSLECGNTRDDIHEALKCGSFGKVTKDVLGIEIIKAKRSTKSLSTVEFEEFQQWIREWASLHRGIYIPLPNEI